MGAKFEHYMELMERAAKQEDYDAAAHYLALAGFFKNEPEEGQSEFQYHYGDRPPV